MKSTSELMRGMVSECFFDWYQVTFTVKMLPEWFINAALSHWDFLSVEECRPKIKQYQRGLDIKRGDRVYFHVCWGGYNEGLHVLSTGSISHDVAMWMQSQFKGKYGVSRADVRIDSIEPGMWDYFYQRCKDASDDFRTSRNQMGDWDVPNSPSGRTYYIGSRNSVVQARLYEKGKKEHGNPYWVRLELEVRPSKREQKIKAAYWSPSDFWRSAAWSNYLYGAVMYRAEKITTESMGTVWQASTREKALLAMINQYGNTLEALAESLPGGWLDLGAYVQNMRAIAKDNGGAVSGYGQESPYEEVFTRLLAT